jgi:hypothetical protein
MTDLNLDTSVLVNYVYATLPGNIEDNAGSRELLDSGRYYTVIGGKAKAEFERLCDRRYTLYEDVADFLETSGQGILEYSPVKRTVSVSPNDRTHLELKIQYGWHEKTQAKQLSLLRRCYQDLRRFRTVIPEERVDETHPPATNDSLRARFEDELAIAHDCDILVDAVAIRQNHSIDTLVAIDSDIIDDDHQTRINGIIQDIVEPAVTLSIVDPQDLTSDPA